MQISLKKFSFVFVFALFVILFGNTGTASAQSSGTACHELASGEAAPSGFGAAWDVHSSGRELLLRATCTQTSAQLNIGRGNNQQYIYKVGHWYRNNAWQSHTYTGSNTSGDWVIGSAGTSLSLTSSDRDRSNFFVAYVCTWSGSAWECGCADSTCSGNSANKWQLQSFRVNTQATQPTTPSNGSGSEASDFISQVEQEVHRLVNIERQNAGLSALTFDNRLRDMARAHSADMGAKNYFSHTSPDGCGMVCRFQQAGYAYSAAGENIFMMQGNTGSVQQLAKRAVDGWMNSSGHRANILNSGFTHQGIGVAQTNDGRTYVTQKFSRPR